MSGRTARNASKRTNSNDEAQEHAGTSGRMTLKCSNPDCGVTLAVPSDSAGRRGSCPRCGTSVVFPSSPTPRTAKGRSREDVPPRDTADLVSASAPRKEVVRRVVGPPTVRVGCIGRGNAGKTALFRALNEGPVGDFLPSGLHVDAGDPREVSHMIRESEQTQKLLHLAGLPPTLVASQIRYFLYEGSERRAAYCMNEVIGQILTHTLPDSGVEQQNHYEEYLQTLVDTEVIWAVIPCPPRDPNPRERRRYGNDLRITMAYLRESLRLRQKEQPVALALVLSKIDTLFENVEEAQSALSDELLHRALGPLVDFIAMSTQISEAVIVPVTAFGFGNAVMKENGGRREGAGPETLDEPFGSEPVWIVRDGVEPLPYNLDALFFWTLLTGLRSQVDDVHAHQDVNLPRICELLEKDLNEFDPWIVPIMQSDKTESH